MKKIKAFCAVTVLALTLSVSVFAGDIASPGAAQPGDIGTPSSVSTPPTVSPNETVVVSSVDAGALSDVLLALLSMF
ncbi:MAG TPA: hypothetical protein VF961_09470 [Pyrinomonadaceae bacterium]